MGIVMGLLEVIQNVTKKCVIEPCRLLVSGRKGVVFDCILPFSNT